VESALWLPATARLMLRVVRLLATKPTAAPGAGSFRADCGLSAGDGRLSGVNGGQSAVDGGQSAVDGEPSEVDGEQSAVAFQFAIHNSRNHL